MSAEHIEQLRQLAATTNATDQKNIDTTLIADKSCKTLRDTCRSVLYGSVKDRRMAAHVNSLPLPKQIKEWLCFNYEISEKIQLEFGMKTVRQQKM